MAKPACQNASRIMLVNHIKLDDILKPYTFRIHMDITNYSQIKSSVYQIPDAQSMVTFIAVNYVPAET